MQPPPFSFDDSTFGTSLSTEDRVRLIASILARGLRRLRDRPDLPLIYVPQNLDESHPNRLAVLKHDPVTVTVR